MLQKRDLVMECDRAYSFRMGYLIQHHLDIIRGNENIILTHNVMEFKRLIDAANTLDPVSVVCACVCVCVHIHNYVINTGPATFSLCDFVDRRKYIRDVNLTRADTTIGNQTQSYNSSV